MQNVKLVEDYNSECTDRAIKQTFDMLVDRISHLENLARIQYDASVFAECCKFGRLNNKLLGYPFDITS